MSAEHSQNGYVVLVGAGPGDPGLLTLKGREALRQCDVVVYDHLVSEALLDFAPATARRIYVGKKAGKHTMSQEAINALLVQEARAGNRVVRLKGGDPFVFGRGGEECLALREQGIRFEVIPGVSAFSAVPAYAGIPLTFRDRSSVFLAVTGHEHESKDAPEVDWASVAQIQGTLIIYMGVLRIREIFSNLIRHGRAADTPAAVIRWGTCPQQETLVGTLATLPDRVEQLNLRPPGLIVVGEVVRLREQLKWFETEP